MKNTSPFRIIVIAFFAVLMLAGVVAFSTYRGESASDLVGPVSVWGTYDELEFRAFINQARNNNDALSGVTYREVDRANFEFEVLEAIASGQSPDLLFIDDSMLHSYLDKVYTMTPESYSRSLFRDNFVDGTEIFFQNDGVVGLPLASDPLVMFWNRDMFASAGIPKPPTSWTDFFELAQQLSIVDESLNVRQSAIAFGETRNVDYYRAIIATLLLQIGNPIMGYDIRGNLTAMLDGGNDGESAHAALRFYTEFSDASKSVYSWNRSMPDSEDAFLSGKLAVHFAPASNIVSLRERNPNLNFAVAEIPTVDVAISQRKSVYAPVYGFVIPRVTDNLGGAFQVAVDLTSTDNMRYFTEQANLAPVRRDIIAEPSAESYTDILKRESLYSRSFLDPNQENTDRILANMVEYITSGQRSIDNAIYVSNAELDDSIK